MWTTDGHTHMVLVASAASHGRKALCSPLIRLQITEHSTQMGKPWNDILVWFEGESSVSISILDAVFALPVFVGVWRHTVVAVEVKEANEIDAVIGVVAPRGAAAVRCMDPGEDER
ncbi:hypothetical protein NQZ68_003103 [Dissostichus eleginoides]|nr:hypothetical protein NQZ68_003103 [Dissostichus eleginoides]